VDIPVQADVFATDGHYGRSQAVVVNPRQRRVVYLVVKESRKPQTERLIPIGLIAQALDQEIRLRCSRRQASREKPFTVTRFLPSTALGPDAYQLWPNTFMVAPHPGELSLVPIRQVTIPLQELVVYRNVRLQVASTAVGWLRAFQINQEDGCVTSLLMCQNHTWGAEHVIIPESAIDHFGRETIFLGYARC
jgi:hypothetical protein